MSSACWCAVSPACPSPQSQPPAKAGDTLRVSMSQRQQGQQETLPPPFLAAASLAVSPCQVTANDLQENITKLNNGVTFMIKHSQKLFKVSVL